jgi:hypothetical protein
MVQADNKDNTGNKSYVRTANKELNAKPEFLIRKICQNLLE